MIKNKKLILTSVISLVIILGVGGAILLPKILQTSPTAGPDTVPVDSNYVRDTNQEITDGTVPANDKSLTAPASSVDSSSVEKPMITRAEQAGDYVRISAILSQASNGICILTATQTGSTAITKQANITVGPSYYTCNGFRINSSEFMPGDWDITVTHVINDKKSISDVRTVHVN